MTWTSERIEAAQEVIRLEDVDCLSMYSVSRSASRELTDVQRIALIDLARIGLAVVKADPETVERVASMPWRCGP